MHRCHGRFRRVSHAAWRHGGGVARPSGVDGADRLGDRGDRVGSGSGPLIIVPTPDEDAGAGSVRAQASSNAAPGQQAQRNHRGSYAIRGMARGRVSLTARMRRKEGLAMLDVKPIKFGVVSERALIKRINRKLRGTNGAYSERVLHKTRGEAPIEKGVPMNYYVVWSFMNALEDVVDDLEAYAREIGVMHEAETLAPAE